MSNHHMCGDDTYIIILYCDVAFTYRHVCQDIPISYTFHTSIEFTQCSYSFIVYKCYRISIIMTIYRRNRHDYNYLIITIIINNILTIFILFPCLISSLFLQCGWTALHLAIRNGQHETVRTLVELGVDKEAKNDVVRNLMMMI